MAGRRRSIVREHLFEDGLAALGDIAEADEFVAGAEWLLAHEPEIGTQVADGSPVWFLPMAPVRGEQVALYYTFDETTVWLLAIQRG